MLGRVKRDAPAEQGEFDLGGARWPRPFRIRPLGHFGVNVSDPEHSKDFYCRLLGFRISECRDESLGDDRGRHGEPDHLMSFGVHVGSCSSSEIRLIF
jgi:hypothetical protein